MSVNIDLRSGTRIALNLRTPARNIHTTIVPHTPHRVFPANVIKLEGFYDVGEGKKCAVKGGNFNILAHRIFINFHTNIFPRSILTAAASNVRAFILFVLDMALITKLARRRKKRGEEKC